MTIKCLQMFYLIMKMTAEEFGRKSMKKGFEHKVVEYNEDNHERYWYK
jgi:hypothetical protein